MKSFIQTGCAMGLLAALVAAPGCGGAAPVDRPHQVVPAGGVLIYQGQPVAGASVTFHPVQEVVNPMRGGKPAARAQTDAQGRFRLWTFDFNDGAVPGDHVVTVSKVEITAPDVDPDAADYDPSRAPAEPPPRYLVPPQYESQTTSNLRANITSDGANEFRFDLDG